MESRQLSAAVVLAVCAAVLVTVPALGVGTGPPAQVENNSTEANGTVGQQVSAFMQTTAVDANATTDSAMWQASVNVSEDPGREVTNRTAQLEQRLDRIETQIARLEEQRDDIPDVAYTARASALNERLAALQTQINETEQTADRVGVDPSALGELRDRTRNTTGPEVSAVARNITDPPRGPPEDRGPLDDSGPGSDRPSDEAGPGNETDQGPPDDSGPGEETDPGNRTDQGPPDTSGPGEETNPGNDADAGNQTDQGPSDDTGPTNETNRRQNPEGPQDDTGPASDAGSTTDDSLETRLSEPL